MTNVWDAPFERYKTYISYFYRRIFHQLFSCASILDPFLNCFALFQIVFDRSKISFLLGPGPKTFFSTAFCYFNHFQIEMVCSRVGSLLCRICIEMLFCYQNCSDLLWEKIVLVIEKNFWNSRLKAKNFQKFWDHLNNLFKQWKDRTISGNRMLF